MAAFLTVTHPKLPSLVEGGVAAASADGVVRSDKNPKSFGGGRQAGVIVRAANVSEKNRVNSVFFTVSILFVSSLASVEPFRAVFKIHGTYAVFSPPIFSVF
jgi:hypothetical protein